MSKSRKSRASMIPTEAEMDVILASVEATVEAAIPAWAGTMEALGSADGDRAADFVSAVETFREGSGWATADDAGRETLKAEAQAFYLNGYLSKQPHNVRSWVRMEKSAFSKLAEPEHSEADRARKVARSAKIRGADRVIAEAFPAEAGPTVEEQIAAVAALDDAAAAAALAEVTQELLAKWKKTLESFEAKAKKLRADIEATRCTVKSESEITKALDAIRCIERMG